MKRKAGPKNDPVIDSQILEKALDGVHSDQIKLTTGCVVCSSPCAPNSAEGLCWVCRRLKISAWRDLEGAENQAASQE
ncbi:MAG TPA: hypothetical protein VHD76_04145 [Bryobacteraceae bacterium]|jgi:hypothetical protein|nr:hypothetical protein [Bryobacteraceae bacterium]